MNDRANNRAVVSRAIITLAGVVVVTAGLRAAETIVIPLILAAFLAMICSAPMFWMHRKGVPLIVAVILIVVAVLAAGLVLTALIGTSVAEFSRSLPGIQSELQSKGLDLAHKLEKYGIDVDQYKGLKYFEPDRTLPIFAKMLSGLTGMLSNMFMILVTVIFILFEASSLPAKLRAVLHDPRESMPRFTLIVEGVRRYLAIKTLVSLLTGACVLLLLTVLGVKYAFLWAVVAYLLNYIPNIGSIVAALPAVAMALIQFGLAKAAYAAVGYFMINAIIGNFVEPRFLGRGLGLSTLVVFLSLLFWGWVFGPIGMLLSVPLTMILKIALDSSEETRWIAVLLSSKPPVEGKGVGRRSQVEPAGPEMP
jgi:predicted PurR-regulated permease PerM